ncbi:MAG TPA: Coq4 family protein [Parvularculaceae bacterium]|nr:Coq4 family protein [Parvularculaceae bacterium]
MTEAAAKLPKEVAPEDIEWINGFPTPPSLPVRPIHALVSVFKLILNKEDTRQVFEVFQALSGDTGKRLFSEMVATPYGRRVVSEPVQLEKVLSDRAWLRSLPEGSFGRVYLAFMEGENLTPEGLLSSAEEAGIDHKGETEFKEYQRMFLHLSMSHDLWHVLTGYGRDALGELCNLVFTRTQTYNPGNWLITTIGMMAQKAEQPGLPILKAMKEARRMGEGVDFILQYDIEELLPLPLDEVRRRLNFITPTVYNAIPEEIKQSLLKPKLKQTQSERERAVAA